MRSSKAWNLINTFSRYSVKHKNSQGQDLCVLQIKFKDDYNKSGKCCVDFNVIIGKYVNTCDSRALQKISEKVSQHPKKTSLAIKVAGMVNVGSCIKAQGMAQYSAILKKYSWVLCEV